MRRVSDSLEDLILPPFHGKREIGSGRFGWGYGCDFFTSVGGVGVTGTMPAGIGYLEAVW